MDEKNVIKLQVVIFTDSYGQTIKEKSTSPVPDPDYPTVHHYLNEGWRVIQVVGTGVAAQYFNRGSFCFVLEKI